MRLKTGLRFYCAMNGRIFQRGVASNMLVHDPFRTFDVYSQLNSRVAKISLKGRSLAFINILRVY